MVHNLDKANTHFSNVKRLRHYQTQWIKKKAFAKIPTKKKNAKQTQVRSHTLGRPKTQSTHFSDKRMSKSRTAKQSYPISQTIKQAMAFNHAANSHFYVNSLSLLIDFCVSILVGNKFQVTLAKRNLIAWYWIRSTQHTIRYKKVHTAKKKNGEYKIKQNKCLSYRRQTRQRTVSSLPFVFTCALFLLFRVCVCLYFLSASFLFGACLCGATSIRIYSLVVIRKKKHSLSLWTIAIPKGIPFQMVYL